MKQPSSVQKHTPIKPNQRTLMLMSTADSLQPSLASQLLTMKLLPPQPPQRWVKRVGLDTAFEQALTQNKQVFLLVAPAGYGKSSTLSEWSSLLARQQWKTAWLNLDTNDRKPQLLRLYICAALENSGADLSGLNTTELCDATITPINVFAATLSSHLHRQSSPIALILDDLHEVCSADAIEVIESLLKHTHQHFIIAIGSRSLPPLAIAKMQSQGRLQRFGVEDLQFSFEEAKCLLPQTATYSLTDKDLEQLLEKTRGWPALFNMAVELLQQQGHLRLNITQLSGSTADIANYLKEEILAHIDPPLLAALVDTAISSKLNSDLITVLSGDNTLAQRLREIPGLSQLMQNIDGQGYWFKIHPLLRDVLLESFQQYPQDQQDRLYTKISAWFITQQLYADAIELTIRHKHYEQALELLTEYGNEIMGHGDIRDYLSLIKQLPEELIKSKPELLIQQGWHHVLVNEVPLSRLIDNELTRVFAGTKIPDLIFFNQKVQRLTSDIFQERYSRANEEGLLLLDQVPEDPLYLKNTVLVDIALSFYHLGDLDMAISYAKQCHLSPLDRGETYSAFYARITLLLCYLTQGNKRLAEEEHTSLIQWLAKLDRPSQQILRFTDAIGGIMAYLNGELDKAEQLFTHSQPVFKVLADSAVIGWIAVIQGRTYFDLGKHSEAIKHLQELLQITEKRRTPISHDFIAGEIIRLAQLIGDKNTVKYTLERRNREPIFKDKSRDSIISYLDYGDACALLGRKDYAQLAVKLKSTIKHLRDAGFRFQQIDFLLTLAEGYRQADNDDKAKATLESALLHDEQECCNQLLRSRFTSLGSLYDDIRLTSTSPLLRERMNRLLTDFSPATGKAEDHEPLSKAELKVANCLQQGMSNKDIAAQLFVSVNTVKSHLKSIYAKLNVTSRTQAIKRLNEL